jgi:restriction system protein
VAVGSVRELDGGVVMSELPPFHGFFAPTLRVLSAGAAMPAREIVQTVADVLGLTAEQRVETIPSGQARLTNRVVWSLSYLSQARAVDRPRRGTYAITERGRDLLAAHPAGFGVERLREFEEFREFEARSKRATGQVDSRAPVVDDAAAPVEQIADSVARLDAAVAQELIERIRTQPPEFLERVVLRLLVAMGYGGSGEVEHVGGPGDGGFDGVINQDALGLGRVYVQAKRYATDNVVGRPAVQGFVGALHGAGAAGGVFITTSRFSPDAITFAAGISPRVILIDAARLGALMVAHGVGVQERQTYRVVELDEDFFE